MADYGDLIEKSFGESQQAAQQAVVADTNSNPEEASRALELAEASGVPANVIHGNIDAFERLHKAALGSRIVKGNPQIQDYINSDPMAAKLSSDDLGQLDTVSHHVSKLQLPTFLSGIGAKDPNSILSQGVKGFKEGFGEGGAGAWMLRRPSDVEYLAQNPVVRAEWATAAVLGAPVEGIFRVGSAVFGGIAGAGAQVARNFGADEKSANQIEEFLQVAPLFAGVDIKHVPPEAQALARQARKTMDAAKPWVDAGLEPPHGIDPMIDQAHVEQSKIDLENLADAFREAQKSATRDRNPEMFAGFIRQHTDARLGISAEAVRALYGEKLPEPNDGILGWVPDIGDQLRVAEATGGDITVPLADWLASADPEIAKQLHDDIRVRASGLTLNEVKDVKPIEPLAQEEELTSFEKEQIAFREKNNLPPPTQEEVATNMQARIRQIEYDRRLRGKPEGEVYPPNPELSRLRERLKELRTPPEVDSLRRGAALEPLEERPPVEEAPPAGQSGGQWHNMLGGGRAYIKPTELYTASEKALTDKVNAAFQKIVPRLATIQEAHGLELSGRPVQGVFNQFTGADPLIQWTFSSADALGTARHEAIHVLRQSGFFTPEEWAVLRKASIEQDWMGKHNIIKRYKGMGPGSLLEESVAEEFGHWQRTTVDAGPLQKIFEKMKQMYEAVRSAVREVFGKDPDFRDLFQKVESGEIGSRRGVDPLDPRAFRNPVAQEEQLSMEGVTRLEDRDLFAKADAIGMTVKQYKKYQDLISKRDAEDTEYAAKKAEKEIAKRQTKEWKEAASALREEVRPDIANRPDIAAEEFLREGRLYGDKVRGRPRLDSDKLTAEQKALLSKDYYIKGGMHPDDVAGLFGYQSGAALVERLGMLVKAREESKLGPKEFVNKIVDSEVERRMQTEHGDLAQNILDEAKDHVISQTQFDMLHEETLAMAAKAGLEMSITQAELKAAVKSEFGKQPLAGLKTDKFLKQAGRAGTLAERALLEEKAKDAFKFKQQQYLSMLMANEAKALEKAQTGFDRLTKQFSKREVPLAKQEYTNWIHDIMLRIGRPPRRSVQDIYEQADRDGYSSLSDFVGAKEADLRELHVPDFLLDQNFRKEYESLTADEFKQANNALKAMAFNARNELKVERAGEKAEFSEVLGQMKTQLESLGDKVYPVDRRPSKVIEQGKSWWWSGITVESMLNRLDRDRFQGVFNQYIIRPFTEASNYKDRLIKEYQGKISAIGKIENMDDLVDNDIFKDQRGDPLIMRRRNVLGILQNVGNENNMRKLAEGYKLTPEQVMSWLAKNTEKADWDRAQKIGDLFEEIFEKANQMSHNISGVGIERLPLEGVNGPHGHYPGWYNPIKYDPLRPGGSRALLGTDIESEGYYRATTPQGYAKARTGYIAPVELNMDIIPVRMQQMLHDIAVRPAVIQMSKFFYDPRFKAAMIDHFGKHQAEEMIPFLKDFANASNFKSLAEQMGSQALEYLRQNTIANLIGLNPGTVAKHGTTALFNSMHEVGPINWTREFKNIVAETVDGRASWTMAMEKSEELQRRMRNYTEIIQGHGSEINIRGAQSGFASLRDMVIAGGATPVSISDLLSAVPTWLAAYKDQIAAGVDEGTSVSFANRAVRRAHGSSVLTNRPSISRTNALGSWFTSLYGFFSHMQQKQYELAWKAKDMYKDTFGAGSGDEEAATRHAGTILKGFMAYIIIPAMVEELVTPYTNSEKDSWGKKAAKTMALGISSSLIGVRDFVHAAVNLRDPQAGLAATSMMTGSNLVRDISHGGKAFSKEKAGNLIRHTISLTGVLTGLTNETEAKAAKFMYGYATGQEHPKGFGNLLHGLRTGSTKVKP